MKGWLDPPLSRDEWLMLAIFMVIGAYSGLAYGRWLWAQVL